MDFELVFSRYDEPTEWLGGWPHPLTIYNKGAPIDPPTGRAAVTALPNVGLDTHSILHHLAERYETLARVTLFLCGSWSKRPENVLTPLERYAVAPLGPAPSITGARYVLDDGWPGKIRHWGKWKAGIETGEITESPYTLGEWWDRVLGGPRPETLWYVPGQTFSVAADRVLTRPRAWYRQLAEWFATHGRYPEETHHMERSWVYVFFGGRDDVDLP